ncbi:glycerophosphodiester phosphodiesterase family protein [Amphibacillus cookii]|uniref:glycerophosphodiester phosphodiesterase family protein n=1 Tax=Amphibacillus cookii TaxID=767787 RepID=UPI00195B515C|nr:glycerophosphodiester phosphodiesterase family protein [Amphibacillus cookii]MBM7539920.1 glycerophosphoryl diester phosphodiesterase [Amphibacillus cookii]
MVDVYGHRGSKGLYPENTMLGMRQAIHEGADGVELDVHLTKDDHLIVIHDETLDRTINGNGFINNYNWSELKKMKLSSVYQTYTNYDASWDLERIPLLSEVLDLVEPKRVKLNIELKTAFNRYEGIEQKLIDCVQGYMNQVEITYSSFHLPTLTRLKTIDPDATIAWLIHQPIPQVMDYYYCYNMDYLHVEASLLKERHFVNQLDLARVRAWTVNDEATLMLLFKLGIDGIITDFPSRAIELKKRWGQGPVLSRY